MTQRAPCAQFYEEDPFSWYHLCLEGFFALSLIISVYVIYCIVVRSPKNMSTYKWYLLYHQLVAMESDIAYNYIAKPVLFLPFIAGYPMGLFRGRISSHFMDTFCLAGTVLSITTIVHLFWFRYLTIRRLNRPPLHYWLRLPLLYLSTAFHIFQNYQNAPDTESAVMRASNEYECVGEYLLQIDSFIMYDFSAANPNFKSDGHFWTFFCMFEISYLSIFSLKETYLTNMSPQLARLHRKFLIQLIVQAVTPFCIIAVPFAIYSIAVAYQASFLGQGFGHILTTAVASFSSTSGMALVIMIPSYRPAFFLRKGRRAVVKPTTAFSITQSRVTGVTRNARISVPF